MSHRPNHSRHFVSALLLIPLTVGVWGCGEETSNTGSRPSALPSGLVLTAPGGAKVTFEKVNVECGPSDYDPDMEVVQVSANLDGASLLIQIVPADVEGGRSFDLPADGGTDETGPAGAFVFAGTDDFEASSDVEGASGTLTIAHASCDPAAVDLRIDGALGSEFGEQPVQIKGHLKNP